MAIQTKTALKAATAALPAPITRVALIAVLDDMIDSYEDIIQQYTTAQRDALTPVLAQKIFNTTNARLEIYNGTTWIACSQKQVVAVDCSANPNYAEASVGDLYIVSVAGKIGGAGGKDVYVGDLVYCIVKNAGGTEASVGTSWQVCHSQGSTDTPTYYTEITLSSAEILALNSTPKTLVAAPGAGKIILPIEVVHSFTYNSIQYATNTNLAVKHNGVAGNGTAIGGVGYSASIIQYGSLSAGITALENAALVVLVQTGDPTAGNSTSTVGVYYKIHTV